MSKVSRRAAIQSLAAAGLAVAAGRPLSMVAATETAKPIPAKSGGKPNILLIMTDQQHWKMMSCMGNPWLKTPAMDSIAASGVRFNRVYVTNPVCMPSRFSMTTGRMPSCIKMESNGPTGFSDGDSPVPENIVNNSLGFLFKNAGYETVFSGKTHFGQFELGPTGYTKLPGDERDKTAEACAQFILGKREKPFFLTVSLINPHDICYMAINEFSKRKSKSTALLEPYFEMAKQIPEKDFYSTLCPPLPANHEVSLMEPEETLKHKGATSSLAREQWDEKRWRLYRWLYCRLTEKVDAEIGVVLKALRSSGLDKNTVVVFTSDHGDMDAAHRQGQKVVLYEESTRVPFLISVPGEKRKNTTCDAWVSTGLDLLPTLCDYAGIEAPKGLQGRSVRGFVENPSLEDRRTYVPVETKGARMIRTERYKYCIYEGGRNREFLVDLEKDPGEMNNVAGQKEMASVLLEHRKIMADWVTKNGDTVAEKYIIR